MSGGTESAAPLSGITILDLSRLMPFAYGTHLLADLGAHVLKVEMPGGEPGRGMRGTFELTNRGKRSITLDLRRPEAVAIIRQLVASHDVVFESFRPGYLSGLGLGWDHLSRVRPSLVYCSASGYGQDGPYSSRAGHDVNYLALAGHLQAGGPLPIVPYTPFADMAIGWAAALAIVTGVLQARLTGRGSHIDVNMSDVSLSLNALAVGMSTTPSAKEAGPLSDYPWPDLVAQQCPCYGLFKTADDRYVALANVEPKFWQAFLTAIDRPDLQGDRFSTGRRGASVRAEIEEIISRRTLAEWDKILAQPDICYSPVNSVDEALREPQFRERGMANQLGDGRWHIGLPMQFSTWERSKPAPPNPLPGEANDEIYGALGASSATVQRWRNEGVI
jgi:crotonobetainyl-CoA:carnitine CoA-transferase CaiB-like acyl-CoA transferase